MSSSDGIPTVSYGVTPRGEAPMPATHDPVMSYTQDYRSLLIDKVGWGEGGTFRKTARVIAVQQHADFTVLTDRGPMRGRAGDWLVTNHPSDDTGSDLWSISAERMAATYREVAHTWPGFMTELHELLDAMVELQGEQRGAAPRQRALAITAVEEALLRIGAAEGAELTQRAG